MSALLLTSICVLTKVLPLHYACHIEGLVPASWAEHGKEQLSCHAVEYQQWHITVAVIVEVEQGLLLCTVGVGISVICVKYYLLGGFVKRANVLYYLQVGVPLATNCLLAIFLPAGTF